MFCNEEKKINFQDRFWNKSGLEVIKLECILKLKIKRNKLAACGHASSQSLRFILSLRMNLSFITLGPGHNV